MASLAEPNPALNVFVSYAHEDTSRIADDVLRLKEVAGTVWLDESIGAGTPWREEIAEAIGRCDVFLLFVSPASISSEHCARELNYALETRRRIIAVHLEPTELSPGQKMSLMDRQAILRYELEPGQYRGKLSAGVLAEVPPATVVPTASTGTSTARRSLIYAGLTVLLAFSFWILQQQSDAPETQAVRATDQAALAVMPFKAISGEQAVADGFHADVLDRLTRLPGVPVISIDSLNAMDRRQASTTEIAQALNVSHVVQGDVQQAGDRLRINLKLIEGERGTVIWSERYDRSLANLFSVQTEIANRLADALDLQLNAGQGALLAEVPTTNAEAWGLYQQARRDRSNRIALLEQAIALDPAFADAISWLATIRARMNDFSDENIALAQRAVALNPGRADYRVSLAMALSARFPMEARSEFEEARSIDPLATSLSYAQTAFWVNGFLDLSLELFAQQRRLDPLNPSASHVRALIADRDFDRALEVADLYQDIAASRMNIGLHAEILAAQNHMAESIEALRSLSPDDWAVVSATAWQLNAVGLSAEASAFMETVSTPAHVAAGLAPIQRDLGRLADADLTHMGQVQRLYLQADRLVAQYAAGDRDQTIEAMSRMLAALNEMIDEAESRFGSDHLPGYLFRVDAPLAYPLMARLTGDEEMLARMARKIRHTLANGGTLELPKREHLVLMMLAALEHDHEEAVRQLDLARQSGLRNLAMLNFFGLVTDPYQLFGGLTDDVQYQSLLSAIEASNQTTRDRLRKSMPELFVE